MTVEIYYLILSLGDGNLGLVDQVLFSHLTTSFKVFSFVRCIKNYKSLPFNPNLRKRAQELRRAGILHEALLWNRLKSGRLNGLDFDRQKVIGDFIVDFYCAEMGVVIEVDGPSHDRLQESDEKRDKFLTGLGLEVIRITAKDVLQNLDGVIGLLREHASLKR